MGMPRTISKPNARWAGAIRAATRDVADLLLPPVCAACGGMGAAACVACLAELARGPTLVRPGVAALARHDGAAREFVLAHKERGRRDLAEPLGRVLGEAVPRLATAQPDRDGTWWFVPVPSRPAAARARGGQHVLALARWCARGLAEQGHPAAVAPALRLSARTRDAVGLDRAERVTNLSGRVWFTPRGAPPLGAPVVLIDDVVTSGATIAASTRVLAEAGYPLAAALTLTAAGAESRRHR